MRHVTVVAVFAALVLGALPVSADDPPWKQGMPPELRDSPLAPIAQPPAPKALGEIPVEKIKLPPGFKASLWAHGIHNARVMTWGDKGTLFVSSRVAGNVYAVVDKGGSREVRTIAKGPRAGRGASHTEAIAVAARAGPGRGRRQWMSDPRGWPGCRDAGAGAARGTCARPGRPCHRSRH